jgi:hexosaminidase
MSMKGLIPCLLVCCILACGLNAGATEIPALIPLPQQVVWQKGSFSLKNCQYIFIQQPSLQKEAKYLKQYIFSKTGRDVVIVKKLRSGTGITLGLAQIPAKFNASEAYRLTVNSRGVMLKANTADGIFKGLQTIAQLNFKNDIKSCAITDFPAFKWRGYMIDVGRNFQSVALLKKQIDVMSKYKMNIFHFHLTEDIAWRLQIKKYPQLTEAANMVRNKGNFYTVEELKDLIQYCKDRYITLVPEIDMPGHSAAFTRAFGTDMQTSKGLGIVKEILKEIAETYDIPYIHIGADEVVIKNKQFLPEVTRLIKSYNKQVVAWAPGGNYDDKTIRQLWKDEGDKDVSKKFIKYIDSKSLYISDMDPLSTVITIFNRKFGGKLQGDQSLLGAEFCLWNDRLAAKEADLLSMNAVYPALLTFAERSWCGGGYELAFNLGESTSTRAIAFKSFEERLLRHKKAYFSSEPFVYIKQTDLKWKLIGPYANNGDLKQAFPPETAAFDMFKVKGLSVQGGTIWLWHTNAPAVKAWLPEFTANSTWYAQTNFFSKADTVISFWIDLKDQSRSGADATPNEGEWDYKQSKLWVNGIQIDPPKWKFAGRPKGKIEEPLVDEGFYYRPPIEIKVKKGWNKVLFKLPMDQFGRKDWQMPPKWMFTFIPVRKGKLNYELEPLVFEPNALIN